SPSAIPASAETLREALRHSRYAQRLLAARPQYADELEAGANAGWSAEAMHSFLDQKEERPGDAAEDTLASRLRELRARVMLRLAARDLAGIAPLEEVTATMSALAEVAL